MGSSRKRRTEPQQSPQPHSTPPQPSPPGKRRYYPAFIDVEGRKCVVLGGGVVAGRKVSALLKAGADVRVISPALTKGLMKKKASGAIKHTARRYRKGDLRGAALAIAATGSDKENERAARDAEKLNVLINVVDTPALCGFIVPSVLHRGPLQIAVSTSGASPAMAREIRKELEALYGAEFGRYLRECARDRGRAIKSIKDPLKRRRALMAAGSAGALRRIRDIR